MVLASPLVATQQTPGEVVVNPDFTTAWTVEGVTAESHDGGGW